LVQEKKLQKIRLKNMFVVNGRFLTQKQTGIQRYAFEMCNRLYDMGADFIVAIPNEINPDYSIKFKTVKCGILPTHLWEQISLPRFLKKQGNPLLVSFSGSGPLNYNNQIMTIHDLSYERYPEWFSKGFVIFYKFAMPKVAHKAHAVITVSEFSKKEISHIFSISKDKIHVIPCAPAHSESQKILAQTDSNTDKYILTVSSMDPRKNFIRLVEAFKRIEDKSIKLYIIGMQFKAFNTPDLKKLINENVVLPGYISDEELQQKYKDALFFIYPSLYEGFGIPPLEAMTYGCPVIDSDIPALRETSGDAALYVNPTDINDTTQKMNLLVKDSQLRESLREKGFEQIKKYSWEKSARKVLDLVKQYS